MSPLWTSIVTALGGLFAGFALAGPLLWCQQQELIRTRRRAERDDTTGLPNRRALLAALRAAGRHGKPHGVVLLDLDHFKAINDIHGHETGNDVLAAVGRRLAALGAPVALAARLSGDEFALLVIGSPEQVAHAAQAGWQIISRSPVTIGDLLMAVTVSVGYTSATTGGTARALLHDADMAMYQAKRSNSGPNAASQPAHLPAGTRFRDLPRS